MKIFILDDERETITQMKAYIKKYAKDKGIPMQALGFTDLETFFQEYEKSEEKPYLVILKVGMKKMSGIEVARVLREKGSSVRLILTDVSEEHAMDAFDVHADGYLKKPISYHDFVCAMSRFRIRFVTESHTIEVRAERSKVNLHTADILFAESRGHNVWIYSRTGEYKTQLTMRKLTEIMQEESSFLSCGRSYLVNMAYISRIDAEEIVMNDGSRIPIPVRLRKGVIEKHLNYASRSM